MKRTFPVVVLLLAVILTACSSDSSSSTATPTSVAIPTSPSAVASPASDNQQASKGMITVYASPSCGCCHLYIPYLEENGYATTTVEIDDVNSSKEAMGIPEEVWSCHTALIDDYFIEGHVPVEAIDKLLAEKPKIDGIALPGMPLGSPGMNGEKTAPFEIVAIDGDKVTPFMTI